MNEFNLTTRIINGLTVTPTLVEYHRVQKWDGKMPSVLGKPTPFVDLRK